MINLADNSRSNTDNEINEFTTRVIIAKPDMDFIDDDLIETAYTYAIDDDDFRLDGLGDDLFDDELDRAADEELSIVDAYEIGIGYGLDEEELAHFSGKLS